VDKANHLGLFWLDLNLQHSVANPLDGDVGCLIANCGWDESRAAGNQRDCTDPNY